MSLKLFSRKPKADVLVDRDRKGRSIHGSQNLGKSAKQLPQARAAYEAAPSLAAETDPLKRMVQQGRLAAVLREPGRWRTDPEWKQIAERTRRKLEEHLALVPAGWASLAGTIADEGGGEEEIDVQPFYLAVHPVTNAEFQHFVDDSAYDRLELWPEDIWPHLIEFQDLTGSAGPRYWRDGRHDRRLADHPVVGVSWYEAYAYSRWGGLRLPTEAEWQMTASWRIKSSAGVLRRFPWGDSMDCTRCNVWASGRCGTAAVTEFERGAGPNGVMQLIGNVWEWMEGDFAITDGHGRHVIGEMPMKGVRGAAFDTYFETQATAEFRSGLIALTRNHNTGFRCAVGVGEAKWMQES